MHLNKAFTADLILYGVVPGRLLIPIMKIKDPFARSESGFYLRFGWKFRMTKDRLSWPSLSYALSSNLETI